MAELIGGANYGLPVGPSCTICGNSTDSFAHLHLRVTEAQQLAHQCREAGAPVCDDCAQLAALAFRGYQSWRGFDAHVTIAEVVNIVPLMRTVMNGAIPAIKVQPPKSSGLLWDLIPMLASGDGGRGYGPALWLAEILRAIVNGDDVRATYKGETLLMRLTSHCDDWNFGVINHCDTAQDVFAKTSPYEEGARLLLSAGCDMETRNSMGDTAVLQAANGGGQYGRTKGLALALKLGGDPYAKDKFGKNAFDIARGREADVLQAWKAAQESAARDHQSDPIVNAQPTLPPHAAPPSPERRRHLMSGAAQVFAPLAPSLGPSDDADGEEPALT